MWWFSKYIHRNFEKIGDQFFKVEIEELISNLSPKFQYYKGVILLSIGIHSFS